MMRIEDYWEEKKSYYISFMNMENRIINRLILLSPDIRDRNEIEMIIYRSFSRVKKILVIDELEDALLLKREDSKIDGEKILETKRE